MKPLIAASMLALVALGAQAGSAERANPLQPSETWDDLERDFVDEDVTLKDGAALFSVDAPYRAHDAATVPIVIEQTDLLAPPITEATVVIDENPAPMAADLTFGEAMAPLKFELRVRVNQYSNIRVLAKTEDGLFMTGRFVKASGGCSAPATKDPEAALASMGLMRLKQFAAAETAGETGAETGALPASSARREAQIMIRHPNYSGLQRDQITQLFIGAHFISKLEVFQGDDMLFTLEGGISVSENPVFRFNYADNGAPALHVRAEDTEGNVFEQVLAKDAQS